MMGMQDNEQYPCLSKTWLGTEELVSLSVLQSYGHMLQEHWGKEHCSFAFGNGY